MVFMMDKKLTWRDYLVVSSLLFGLFFGVGNLIFPVHLGQLAGHNWLPAVLGFLVTGVLLPLGSVLAIAMTRAEGVFDIGKPLGKSFALVFMVLIHATIGPFFGTPRTATVSFSTGLAPFVPEKFQTVTLFGFSALFFLVAFLLSYKESHILKNIGKLLNPLFLLLLTLVFFVAFLNPLGAAAGAKATAAYAGNTSFVSGFLEGYNTMDALAGLAFGVTVVSAIRAMGVKRDGAVALVTAKAGVLSMSAVALVYFLLTLLGVQSLGAFKVSENGGVALSQVVTEYGGTFGQAFLAALITVTSLTTAVGLVAAFAQDFHKHFPKVSYHAWLALSCLMSFGAANFGLDTIITWSLPVLMFLYPLAMVLIVLSVTSKLFKRDSVVYFFTVLFTVVPAFFDMVASLPAVISQSAFGKAVVGFQNTYLPLASYSLSWLVPALVGLALGLILHFTKSLRAVSLTKENE
ncbi:branched-chain amino acid transport system II carrier protein [Ligilactobacillus equi]|uniref:branched-chain amino acid transport system II carrier protein n=1 Tax=Ligilactobacillus equi TaxID=137357 RepID=UPI002ED5615C